ncbi:hypothetical protein ACQKM9_17260 [Viridibacillus sp. NPDC093762]|uniref:hypothetical protein n=1 Tax=Viridibacillus sp. NPDC093762 TaxID=3390720 RepID=UPI003D0922D2
MNYDLIPEIENLTQYIGSEEVLQMRTTIGHSLSIQKQHELYNVMKKIMQDEFLFACEVVLPNNCFSVCGESTVK